MRDGRPHVINPNSDSYFKIYPNPGINFCIVEYSLKADIKDAFLQVMDINGKIIKKINLDKSNDLILISLNMFSAGIYLVQMVENNQTVETQKFVKY